MASNQKTTQQQKTPKTNCFLSCFGFSSKTKSFKNKPKKNGVRKKFFKFCWPKLKVLTIERKKFIFEVKTAALKASHNIILEATKSQQLKQIDHHVVSKTIQVCNSNTLFLRIFFKVRKRRLNRTETSHRPTDPGLQARLLGNRGNDKEKSSPQSVSSGVWSHNLTNLAQVNPTQVCRQGPLKVGGLVRGLIAQPQGCEIQKTKSLNHVL